MEVDDINVTICRLCAEMTSSKSFIPLFTEDKKEQTVTRQINQLVNNLISPNDGLPQDVCLNCADNVAKFYYFVSNIIETQNKLRRIMLLPEIKKIDGMSVNNNEASFLKNGTVSKHILKRGEDGFEKATSGENFKTLTRNPRTIPLKEDNTTVRDRSANSVDIVDIPLIDLSNGHEEFGDASSVSQISKIPRPTFEERCNPKCLRLYSCMLCNEKFKIRKECVQHVLAKHPEMKNSNTLSLISESVIQKMSSLAHQVLNKEELQGSSAVAGHTINNSSKVVSTPEAATQKQPVRRRVAPQSHVTSRNKVLNPAGNNRRRKVLDIDGFLKEHKERISRYICDVCGRTMASAFAFVRHLREHDYSDEEETHEEPQVEKKPLKPIVGYCKACKKLVADSSRHKIYHSIIDLESGHSTEVKVLNIL